MSKTILDFLKKIQRNVNQNTRLYYVDIVSLYTSIPHELGVDAVRYYINKYRHLIPSQFTNTFIIESIIFLLKNNNFRFD